MAYSNGRIYVDTSDTPHIGVSIADIQAAVGLSRNDIGGLITTGNINKWAKYKPEHHPNQKRPLSNSDRAANNFGLTLPAFQRNLETIAANYASYYQYTRPASVTDWYRFSDWVKCDNGWVHGVGYLRSARCFYESDNFTTNSYSGTPNYYVNYNHDTGVSLTVVWASNMTDEEISRSDLNLGLSSISNAYLGVIVKIGTSYRLVCAENVIGNAAQTLVTIPHSVFASSVGSSVTLYPVLSSGNENATGEGISGTTVMFDLLPLPTTPYTFQIVNADNVIALSNETLTTSLNPLGSSQTVSFACEVFSSADIEPYTPELYITLYGQTTDDVISASEALNHRVTQGTTYYSKSWTGITPPRQDVMVIITDTRGNEKMRKTATLSNTQL